jgi:serine/threonine-protein kinase HipA
MHQDYVNDHPDELITFTMPVTEEPYHDNRLFPFFEGLIPEGWLLDIASKNCIGAVSIIPIKTENDE